MKKFAIVLITALALSQSVFASTEVGSTDEFNEGPDRVTTAEFVSNPDGTKTLNLHLGDVVISGALTEDEVFHEGLYYLNDEVQKPFGIDASVSLHGGKHIVGIRYAGVNHPDILDCSAAE